MTPRTSALLTAPLLVALAGSLVAGIASRQPDLDRASTALNDFALNESAFGRDLLSARAGLLRNYDPINDATLRIDNALLRLRVAAMKTNVTQPLDSLIARQKDLGEKFKSNNALLQNALAYYQLFSERLQGPTAPPSLTQAVNNLSAAMLQMTLDTSTETVQAVDHQLDLVAAQPLPPDLTEAATALLAYGRLLRDILPATDTDLRAIFRLPTAEEQTKAASIIEAAQQADRGRTTRSRILLYATSFLLLLQIINLAWQLQRRRMAARRRVAFERSVASLSVRLISSSGAELTYLVNLALAELANLCRADRAYLLVIGIAEETYSWARPDVEFPPQWPAGAARLLGGITPSEHGVTYVSDRTHLPDSPLKQELAAAGVARWTCIASENTDRISCLLGLDGLEAAQSSRPPELRLLRLAFDAIANAVRREIVSRERAQLEQSVQRARQMETIAALAGGVAHNFNNIVGTILGYAEMMEDAAATSPKLDQQVSGIRQAGERARVVIEQILSYGRVRDIRRSCVDFKALITETISQLQLSLPAELRIVTADSTGTACHVVGEPAQLQQVIMNLCNNAAQAMDLRGEVLLSLDRQTLSEERRFSHGRLPAGRYVRLAISDHGRGVDPDVMDRLFEPFFTTRSSGHGLGLATARNIVQEHGGALHVESTVGVGTRIEVWLAGAARDAPGDAAGQSAAEPFGNGETILVYTDDVDRRLRDEELIAALGYEPIGFSDKGAMQTAVAADPQRFDAAILDLRHTGRQTEASEFLAQVRPDLPIILVAAADLDDIDTGLVLRRSRIVSQPLTSDKLAEAFKSSFNPATSRTRSPQR
jgi:signal transduction histidine kinase